MLQHPLAHPLLALAHAEMELQAREFVAPIVPGRGVEVRIGSLRTTMRIVPPTYQGWGVFRPLSHTVAVFVREASDVERREYLEQRAAASLD